MAQRSRWRSDLALVGATALATVAIYRQFAGEAKTSWIATGDDDRQAAPPDGDDRGRHAANPLDIPGAGWKDILFRTYEQINEDRLMATAAGVVFYGLLAIFPAITALVSSYGLFADPSTIGSNLQSLALMLPEGSFSIVRDQIGRVLASGSSNLSITFAAGLLIAIWSANAGMKAVMDALNVVYDEKEKRGFIKLNLVSLCFTIAALAAIIIMVGAVIIVPLLLHRVGLEQSGEMLISLGRWPAIAILLMIALGLLYRFGPSRTTPRWQWLSVGAVAATMLWLAGSALLSWYLSNFANYNATYGSLGTVIGLMIWMWMSTIVILCGAELNSEIEHQTRLDSTVGRPKPLGARGATAADTVGRRVSQQG